MAPIAGYFSKFRGRAAARMARGSGGSAQAARARLLDSDSDSPGAEGEQGSYLHG